MIRRFICILDWREVFKKLRHFSIGSIASEITCKRFWERTWSLAWGDEKREEALLQFLWNILSLTLELGRAKNLVHLGTSVFHSTVMDGSVAYIMMLDLFKSRRLVQAGWEICNWTMFNYVFDNWAPPSTFPGHLIRVRLWQLSYQLEQSVRGKLNAW